MPPLNRIADHCAIFLDFDGTLLSRESRSDELLVDGCLLYLLDDLYVATAGAVAIISSRSLADLDSLLAPLRLPLAGSHGAQRRRGDGSIAKCVLPATVVWQTRMLLRVRLRHYAGLYIEDKGCAFAIHHHDAPPTVLPRLRAEIAQLAQASGGIFAVDEDDEVFELRPRACDKGAALESFMCEAPFQGRFPIFIGAERSDRAAFAAVGRVNGMAIGVGAGVIAPWWLPDPAGVRSWLRACLGLGN